jgi:hypothetical protein
LLAPITARMLFTDKRFRARFTRGRLHLVSEEKIPSRSPPAVLEW